MFSIIIYTVRKRETEKSYTKRSTIPLNRCFTLKNQQILVICRAISKFCVICIFRYEKKILYYNHLGLVQTLFFTMDLWMLWGKLHSAVPNKPLPLPPDNITFLPL